MKPPVSSSRNGKKQALRNPVAGSHIGSFGPSIPEIKGPDVIRAYEFGRKEIPEREINTCRTFGVTVPISEFREPRRRFLHLNSNSVYAPILELFFMIFDPMVLGGQNVPNQPFHKSATEVKFDISVEMLVSTNIQTMEEVCDRDIVGYRVFAHIYDDTIIPQKIVDNIIGTSRIQNTIHLKNIRSRWDLETKVYAPFLNLIGNSTLSSIENAEKREKSRKGKKSIVSNINDNDNDNNKNNDQRNQGNED